MFGEFILFTVLSNLVLTSNVVCAVNDVEQADNKQTRNVLEPDSFLGSIAKGIQSFLSDIKKFFVRKNKFVKKKANRVKSAFNNILSELQNKNILAGRKMQMTSDPDVMQEDLDYIDPKPNDRKETSEVSSNLSAEQIIVEHGYLSESHTVLTADGYMLTMQRVLIENSEDIEKVVILHHGLLGSSDDWLVLGRKKALPYLLCELGFDVWLLNARGNKYSRIHTNHSIDQKEFWDFSWHEMGVYDLPAAIKYISGITNKAEINYIGHSMGGTALLVLLSTFPEYNYLLRSGTLLAPLAFMYHVNGPIKMLANFYRLNGQDSLNFLGNTEFLSNRNFPDQIIEKYCNGDERACSNPLLLLVNGGKKGLDPQLMSKVLSHGPGGSVKTVIHYVQLVNSGFFQKYDYGVDNYRIYKNATPEKYNLKRITLPITLFSSPSDWLATESDVKTMLPLLQNVEVHHVVKAEGFGHFDFVWSQDAPKLVFDFIPPILESILPHRDLFFQD